LPSSTFSLINLSTSASLPSIVSSFSHQFGISAY
jgi:hypothetical protein